MCRWIFNCDSVEIVSDNIVNSIGALQGTVLSPLQFTFYTSDFATAHFNNIYQIFLSVRHASVACLWLQKQVQLCVICLNMKNINFSDNIT